MKTIFGFALLVILTLNISVHCKRKSRRTMDIALSKSKSVRKIGLPTIKKVPIFSKKEQIKRNTLKMLREAKNTEDFLKMFKIPYKKRMKTKQTKTNILTKTLSREGGSIGRPGPKGFKGVTDRGMTEFKGKEEVLPLKPEFELVMASQSNDGQPSETTIKQDDLSCKPRPTVYSLPTSTSYAHFPACFQLNQCGGCCSTTPGYICRPTELSIVTAQTFVVDYYSGEPPKQKTITLTHHKSCACQCRLDQSDCLPTQTLDKDLCYCACTKQDRTCPSNKMWSDFHCDCICKEKPTSCPNKQVWNEETCGCECIKQNCSAGQTQDPSTCYCVNVS